MKKLILLALLGTLAACNTVAGAGEDVSAGARTVQGWFWAARAGTPGEAADHAPRGLGVCVDPSRAPAKPFSRPRFGCKLVP